MHFQQCALVTLNAYMMGTKGRHACSHGSYKCHSSQHQFLWLDHDQGDAEAWTSPPGIAATSTVPGLLWVGGNPKMPRKARGWVGFQHPMGLQWWARSDWQDFYFTVLKLWTFWGCSSPEVSCEMARLSVCLGLPAEGLVSLTPLTPCRTSLSLSSLEEGGHLQANAAWSLPSVQDTWAKWRNLRGLTAASLCTLQGGHLNPCGYLPPQESSHTIFSLKRKILCLLFRDQPGLECRAMSLGVCSDCFFNFCLYNFTKFWQESRAHTRVLAFMNLVGCESQADSMNFGYIFQTSTMTLFIQTWQPECRLTLWVINFHSHKTSAATNLILCKKKCIWGSRLGLQKYARLLFHVCLPVSSFIWLLIDMNCTNDARDLSPLKGIIFYYKMFML